VKEALVLEATKVRELAKFAKEEAMFKKEETLRRMKEAKEAAIA
jgi:hypothetical protein